MVLAGLCLLGASPPAPVAPEVTLRTLPQAVHFTTANAKEQLSGTVLFLILEQRGSGSITPDHLDLIYYRAGEIVRSERLAGKLLQSIDFTNISPTRLYPAGEAARVRWPHAYRLTLMLPAAAEADKVEARLTFGVAGQIRWSATSLAIAPYRQKTSLVFPFRGPGIISAAGALNAGHRNRSGMYAVDALGLTETYGPMRAPERDGDPTNYAGWGREIIAPADGKVVVARNDHVEQPVADKSDPAYFLPQYRDGGDPGNFVVIDHGNGEFSMIAHFRMGSLRVKQGDHVKRGQVIGLVGNSGDTTGPHVHYQLQNGPDWERADALPVTFSNIAAPLVRGTFFDAK